MRAVINFRSVVGFGAVLALCVAGCGDPDLMGELHAQQTDPAASQPNAERARRLPNPGNAADPAAESGGVENPAGEVDVPDNTGGQTDPSAGGTDPVAGGDPTPDPEPTASADDDEELVTEDDLSDEEAERVDTLRGVIAQGLELGRTTYIDRVTITMSETGVDDDYYLETTDPHSDLAAPEDIAEDTIACPYVDFYERGDDGPTGESCEYLIETVTFEASAELPEDLEDDPLPDEVLGTHLNSEATFWQEQGAVSGIEERRILVRQDVRERELCAQEEAADVADPYERGIREGRRLYAAEFNRLLSSRGFSATYPDIETFTWSGRRGDAPDICNADTAFVEPARRDSITKVDVTISGSPLCPGYTAGSPADAVRLSQAQMDYEAGVAQGIEDEYALASVASFEFVRCTVSDPLLVDLDSDGFELSALHEGVNFDIWGYGRAQAVAWVEADDGLLAIDRNGNGLVDDGSELFGDMDGEVSDGFADLARLDRAVAGGDGDGLMDSDDAAFERLVIWRDLDQSGTCEAGEVTPVAELGVTEIDLTATASDLEVAGNRIPMVGAMRGEGVVLMVGDALLRAAPFPRISQR